MAISSRCKRLAAMCGEKSKKSGRAADHSQIRGDRAATEPAPVAEHRDAPLPIGRRLKRAILPLGGLGAQAGMGESVQQDRAASLTLDHLQTAHSFALRRGYTAPRRRPLPSYPPR